MPHGFAVNAARSTKSVIAGYAAMSGAAIAATGIDKARAWVSTETGKKRLKQAVRGRLATTLPKGNGHGLFSGC